MSSPPAPSSSPTAAPRRSLSLLALMGVALGLLALMGGYWLFSLKYFYVQINGESMAPTFAHGDRVIFEKVEQAKQGDLIIFSLPPAWEEEWLGRPDPRFIKRVNAVAGDTLTWDGENWLVNGEWVSGLRSGTCPIAPTEVVLQEGEYFVTGDTSLGHTLDSREAFCKELPYLVEEASVEELGRPVRVF